MPIRGAGTIRSGGGRARGGSPARSSCDRTNDRSRRPDRASLARASRSGCRPTRRIVDALDRFDGSISRLAGALGSRARGPCRRRCGRRSSRPAGTSTRPRRSTPAVRGSIIAAGIGLRLHHDPHPPPVARPDADESMPRGGGRSRAPGDRAAGRPLSGRRRRARDAEGQDPPGLRHPSRSPRRLHRRGHSRPCTEGQETRGAPVEGDVVGSSPAPAHGSSPSRGRPATILLQREQADLVERRESCRRIEARAPSAECTFTPAREAPRMRITAGARMAQEPIRGQ